MASVQLPNPYFLANHVHVSPLDVTGWSCMWGRRQRDWGYIPKSGIGPEDRDSGLSACPQPKIIPSARAVGGKKESREGENKKKKKEKP